LLGTWRTHADYLAYMVPMFLAAASANKYIVDEYMSAFQKVFLMNLDLVWEVFLPIFPFRGRPSDKQPEIFRSLVLMAHFKFASIDNWVKHARSNPVICILIGCLPDDIPGATTLRDFYNRLWRGAIPDHIKYIVPKPKDKPKNGDKLPPKNPGIIDKMADKAINGEIFDGKPERLYQAIFMKLAVLPSAELDLLGDINNLTVSGDGACVSSNANPNGHSLDPDKYPLEALNGYRNCADPWARWGYDSYHKDWFFGYTMYHLSVHNNEKQIDLPIYMQFADGNRFDGVTLISTLAHARFMYKDIFYFRFLTADSAHDNYATYRLLAFYKITPVIDLNKRGSSSSDNPTTTAPLAIAGKDTLSVIAGGATSSNASSTPALIEADVPILNKQCDVVDLTKRGSDPGKSATAVPFAIHNKDRTATSAIAGACTTCITSSAPIFNEGRRPMKNKRCAPFLIREDGVPISENGKPICAIGIEMTNWGADKKRFRTKFRCPLMAGSISYCSLSEECSSSDYGKVVYTKPDDDPRLNTEIPRDSPKWKLIYNNRTATERVNTRILTDYQLERPKRYGRRKLCFFAFDNAINIHLDAQARFSDFDSLLSPWKGAA